MNPILLSYVNENLAAGSTPESIRAALLAAGWPALDVDLVLESVVQPEGVKLQKPRRRALPVLTFCVIVLVAGLTVAYFAHGKAKQAPTITATTTLTTTFQEPGISFAYNTTWQKVGGSELFAKGEFTTSGNRLEDTYLFYNPTALTKAKGELAAFEASPPADGTGFSSALGLLIKLNYEADVILNRMQLETALQAAQGESKNTCSGSDMSNSTDGQLRPKKPPDLPEQHQNHSDANAFTRTRGHHHRDTR